MLQEAIYKFKASGPMLLPELIDNYWIGEIKAYEDYESKKSRGREHGKRRN